MIRHIVWWTMAEEAEGRSAAENAKYLVEEGKKLAGKIESLRSLEISCNIQPTTTLPVQLVLSSTHDDMEGLAAYANHPEHLKFGAQLKKCVTSRQALDYEF